MDNAFENVTLNSLMLDFTKEKIFISFLASVTVPLRLSDVVASNISYNRNWYGQS